MRTTDILRAWRKILIGHHPSLSIEITRECPLKCPGCYAYDTDHLGGGVTLRQLSDFKGERLVEGVMEVVCRYRPLHLSIVGGDPLVRHRELETLLPLILKKGIHVQLVTSAFRRLEPAWAAWPRLTVAVSVDGLAPEHDKRRAPATYERILENIKGQRVTVHCTITGQMMKRSGYLEEFLAFWASREEVKRVWFSLFTPQLGANLPEMLTMEERSRAISDLLMLRQRYTKLEMGERTIRQFATPPLSPDRCVFAQTTLCLSADLKTVIGPCQFGGSPDCSSCGCLASMGMDAIAEHRLVGPFRIGSIFRASLRIGRTLAKARVPIRPASEFRVLR